jgi:CBS domain containing-hemolysin-like protein
MAAIIIGMNLSLVGIGVVVSSLATDVAAYYKVRTNILSVVFSLFSIVFALTVGSIFPKTLARYNAERLGIVALPVVIKFAEFFKLIVRFVTGISNKIIRLFGVQEEISHVRADEIDFLLSNENTSPLPRDSRKLVSNIIDFAEIKISQVMVPLSEIFAVDFDLPKEKIIKSIIKAGFSRVPVYRKNINNIIGIMYAKDLAIAWRQSEIIILEDLIRPVYYVPENAKINKILEEFKTKRHHIAAVVDEFGSIIGIASIEDLLEEIVGEIWDEYDLKEKTVIPINANSYLVETYESISNVNSILNINIPEKASYTTINGWILELFARIPKVGEKMDLQDYSIEIKDADLRKVNKILLVLTAHKGKINVLYDKRIDSQYKNTK